MKKGLKGFILGVVLTTMLMSTAFGAQVQRTIEVVYNSVNLTVNGTKVSADNILYAGTTYVPLRAVAEALGKEVGWDQKTKTASVNDIGFTGPVKPVDKNDHQFDQEYKEFLDNDHVGMMLEFAKLVDLVVEDVKDQPLLYEAVQTINRFDNGAKRVIAYQNVPPRYVEAHKYVVMSTKEYRKITDMILQEIRDSSTISESTLIKSFEYSEQALAYLQKADDIYKEINK